MKLIAHRGAMAYAPENTLVSFEKAKNMGLKAVEFDVQLTKDEEIVVIHDFEIDRTGNGRGKVSELTLEQLREFEFGSWFDKEFQGEKILTLDQVLKFHSNYELINIELKRHKSDSRSLSKKVVTLVKDFAMEDRVLISSFDHSLLQEVSKLDSSLRLGLLIDKKNEDLVDYIGELGIRPYSINPRESIVDKKLVEVIKKLGCKIYSYTVNDRRKAEKFEELGVDGIFTNYPDLLDK